MIEKIGCNPKLLHAIPAPYQHDHEALMADIVLSPIYTTHILHVYLCMYLCIVIFCCFLYAVADQQRMTTAV